MLRQQQYLLALGIAHLSPSQYFVEQATASQADVVLVQATVAHARRLRVWEAGIERSVHRLLRVAGPPAMAATPHDVSAIRSGLIAV
jgi:hypothetical protein